MPYKSEKIKLPKEHDRRIKLSDEQREEIKERKADGRYKPDKKTWAKTMREHRHYKQKLYLDGELKESEDNNDY